MKVYWPENREPYTVLLFQLKKKPNYFCYESRKGALMWHNMLNKLVDMPQA